MGGSTDTAARTIAMYGDFGNDALDELKDDYAAARAECKEQSRDA
ncbi:MAG TPA: hypothetical protein VK459_10210 [Polyangiaceae bacterium]|jgi:hypothetical protein|nr:hypothetical protein [Polyangiaceae bacterium]